MIDLTLSTGTRYTAPLTRVETLPRFRFAWDDELSDYNFKCRTQHPDFVGPPNPPAVLRFYKVRPDGTLPREGEADGDYRVNLEKDPAWKWWDTCVIINDGGVRDVEYWSDDGTAQFNTTGWPRMAYLGMCGNEVKVIERRLGWVRFQTLRPTDWLRARSMSIASHPTLIHRFTCTTWDAVNRRTRRIESTGTPRGQVVYPVVTWEGSAWIPERFIKPL